MNDDQRVLIETCLRQIEQDVATIKRVLAEANENEIKQITNEQYHKLKDDGLIEIKQ
jgi:hypothetical protein